MMNSTQERVNALCRCAKHSTAFKKPSYCLIEGRTTSRSDPYVPRFVLCGLREPLFDT